MVNLKCVHRCFHVQNSFFWVDPYSLLMTIQHGKSTPMIRGPRLPSCASSVACKFGSLAILRPFRLRHGVMNCGRRGFHSGKVAQNGMVPVVTIVVTKKWTVLWKWNEMDDIWESPHFRKPPITSILVLSREWGNQEWSTRTIYSNPIPPCPSNPIHSRPFPTKHQEFYIM